MKPEQKKKECLERLQELVNGADDLTTFLIDEGLLSKEAAKNLYASATKFKELVEILAKAPLQLLEYEWQVLPVERIKITIVTDRVKKEITYGF